MIAAALALCVTGVNAQDDDGGSTNKDGHQILPESGDYGLGVNATPYFSFLNGNSQGDSPFSGLMSNQQMIFGKYFLDDDMAIRGSLRFATESNTTENMVINDLGNSQFDMVEDSREIRNHFYGISGGIEKRRGSGRVQGYFGAELMLGLGSGSTDYTYGNQMSADNPTPTSTRQFDAPEGTSDVQELMAALLDMPEPEGPEGAVSQRVLSSDPGSMWMIQARAFVGAEVFVAPKFSLGAEFGWGPGYQSVAKGTSTIETVNANNEVQEITVENGGNSSFIMNTDNLNGSIRVMFHF